MRANAIAKGNCDQISQKLEVMKHIYDMQRMENIIKFKRESDRIKFVCGTSGLGPRRVIFTSLLQEVSIIQGRIQGGGGPGGQDPPFWGTPKFHKEGKNVAHVRAKSLLFST